MIISILNKFNLFVVSVLILLTSSQIGYSQTVQTFTTVGTQNWICPAGITTVTVECFGGGGGGGGASASLNAAGGGGGGGAYASSVISVVPGTTYTIVVGTNGLGGASSGTSGSSGGNSSFNTNVVVAAGGLGGGGSSSSTSLGAGGAGGAVASSIGTIRYAGGSGAAGVLNLSGGGGGSSAGNTLTGNNASTSTGGAAPSGGVSGASASTVVTGASGTNGLNFGGGASGAHCGTSLIGYPGGNAGLGKVILSYVCTPPTILASANPTLICPGSSSTLTAAGPLTLDQQSTTGTLTGFWMSLSGQQTFIAGYTGILKKVRIHTATYASATNVTVNIMSGTPGSGSLLANVVYFKGTNQNSWDDVIMPGSGVTLSSGSPYYIEILGGSQVDWIYNSSNVYPNGQSWRGGSSYNYDYNFETYMDLNTYLWNPGSISAQTFTANPVSTTNYTVTVTNSTGCVNTQLVSLNVNPALTTTFTQTNVLCNAGNTGAINLTATGGTPITGLPTLDQQQTSASCGTSFNDFWQSFTSSVTGLFYSIDVSILMNSPTVGNWYVYSGSGTGGALLASGSYNFSALGGSQWQNIVITGSPLLLSGQQYTFRMSNADWNQACGGNVYSGGTDNFGNDRGFRTYMQPAPYNYSWSNGATTEDISALTAGGYTVTLSDSKGCSVSSNTTITQPAALSAATTVTNVSCFGGNNGAINLTPAGGTTPYTFNWGGGVTTEDRTGLVAGVYTCTITDANACLTTVTATVTQPSTVLAGSTVVTNVSCFGGNNGAINLTPAGGTTPYTFNWGGGITTEDRTGLVAGAYSCTITDVNTCSVSVSATVTQPAAILAGSTVVTNVSCFGGNNGAINLTPSGGTTPYTFNWGSGITTEDRTGLVAGAYTCTITDVNTCSVSVSASVVEPSALIANAVVSTSINCNGGTGVVTVSASGGTPSYSGTGTYTVVAGTYTYTVTDFNGCVKTTTINVTQPVSLSITVSSSSSSICVGSTASLTASGASTYTWNPGLLSGSTVTVNPTTTTVYTATGTSSLGCVATKTISLIVNTNPTVTAIASPSVICFGASSTLSGSGATSYTWNPGAITSSNTAVSPTVTTNYTLTGVNAVGCSNTKTVSLIVNPNPTVSVVSSPTVICVGATATLTAGGATSYLWNTSATTASITSTPTVTTAYTVTGTNAVGCSQTKTLNLVVNSLPSLTLSSSSASICNNYSVTLTGTGASSYTWNPGSLTNSVVNVSPTTTTNYTLTGINANSCVATETINITVYSNPTVTAASSSSSICVGETATLTASGANTYSWSSGSSNATEDVTPSSSATYTVLGTDGVGCVNTATVNLTVNPLPAIIINPSTTVVCLGSLATFTASGADTYTWSTNDTTSIIDVSPSISSGYTVTGTDVSGCVNTSTLFLTVNSLPTLSLTASPSSICVGDVSTLTVSGANTYSWNTGSTSSSIVENPSVTTIYTVTGSDANGCVSTETINLTVNAVPTLTVTKTSNAVCVGNSATLTVSGASTYSWSTGAITASEVVTPTATTIYTVTGTDAIGCSSSDTVRIYANSLPNILTNVNTNTICLGGTVIFSNSGANTFTLSPMALTGSVISVPINTLGLTVFTVSGTGPLGCLNTKTISVTGYALPIISITPSTATICSGQSVNLNATGANTYTWSGTGTVSNSISASPTANTTYSLIGTDSNGCENSATTNVNVANTPTVSVSSPSTNVCMGYTMNVTASGASSYTWSTGANTNSITIQPIVNTTYSVVGSNGGACTDTVLLSITVLPLPSVSASVSNTSVCSGQSVNLSATGTATAYVWAPGTLIGANQNVQITSPTTYTVYGQGTNGCAFLSTVFVDVKSNSNVTPITTPSVICVGDSAILSVIGGSVPSWSSNIVPTINVVSPLTPTTYTFAAIDVNGCSSVIEFIVGIDPDCNIIIYNGFTPNGDGINDFWVIDNIDKYPDNKVYIYNRWGNEIYSTKDYNNTSNVWDGRMNGQVITSGTYFFVIVDGSEKLIKKGWIEITN